MMRKKYTSYGKHLLQERVVVLPGDPLKLTLLKHSAPLYVDGMPRSEMSA